MSRISTEIGTTGRPAGVSTKREAVDQRECDAAVTQVRDAIRQGIGGRLSIRVRRTRVDNATAHEGIVLVGRRTRWRPGRGLALRAARALFAACAVDRRRVYLIGGEPGGYGVPNGAQRAGAIVGLRHRGLRIAGTASPSPGLEGDTVAWAELIGAVLAATPELVVVALPSQLSNVDTQNHIIAALRAGLPTAWVVDSPDLIDVLIGDGRPTSPWLELRTRIGRLVRRS